MPDEAQYRPKHSGDIVGLHLYRRVKQWLPFVNTVDKSDVIMDVETVCELWQLIKLVGSKLVA